MNGNRHVRDRCLRITGISLCLGGAVGLTTGCADTKRQDVVGGLTVTATGMPPGNTDTFGTGSGGDSASAGDGTGSKFDVGNGSATQTGGDGDPPIGNCTDAAQQLTNQGCEFWAVDLPQPWWSEQEGTVPPEEGVFAIAIANASSNLDANVDVFLGSDATPIQSAVVAVGDLSVLELPTMNIDSQGSSDTGLAFRIETDVPVTAYQFNTLEQQTARFSADASLLFPTHVLRPDYTVFTGDALFAEGHVGAYLSVVAVEDQTVVDVYPTATLLPGAAATGVILDRGEVLTVLSQSAGGLLPMAGEGNLSGSRVAADRPVAVFSGNVAAREPVGAPTSYVCCADHIEEQMLPLEAWGQRYLAVPPVSPSGPGNVRTAYRMVGGEDGISFIYNPAAPPGAPSSLDAYEVAYFVTDQPFAIEGTKPFGIAQFHLGTGAHGTPGDGDPAMVVLPAIEQLQDSYVFLNPPSFNSDYVSVVRPVGTATTLDGQAVANPASPAGTVGGESWELVQVPVNAGAHAISGDAPFQILVYGYADQISYAYPGGSGLSFISEPPPPPQG